jgi:two-component system, sensor histidine kinase and response regulator
MPAIRLKSARWLPLLVALIPVLLATAWAVYLLEAAANRSQLRRFVTLCDDTTELIHDRLNGCRDVLWGTRGLFLASNEVTVDEFRKYISALHLEERYPSILGVAYVEWLSASQANNLHATILAEARRAGTPLTALPPLAPSAAHAVVRYIEPQATNARALGLDLYAEPIRRVMLDRARDRGEEQLTAPLTLVQTARDTTGFILAVPVYRVDPTPTTIDERRSQLLGWVDAPVTAAGLLRHLPLTPDLGRLAIVDETDPDVAALPIVDVHSVDIEPNAVTEVRHIDFGGRRWVLTMQAGPNLLGPTSSPSWLALLSGLMMSVLLGILFTNLQYRRERAESAAQQQTLALQQSEDRWRTAIDTIDDGVWEIDLATEAFAVSQRWLDHLGYNHATKPTTRDAWRALVHPDDLPNLQQAMSNHLAGRIPLVLCELRMRHRDGSWRWLQVRARARLGTDGLPTQLLGSNTDVTERRAIANRLAASEANYRTVVDHLSLVVIQLDERGYITFLNPTWVDLTGVPIDEALGRDLIPFFHPDDRATVEQLVQANVPYTTSSRPELRVLNRLRSYRWVELDLRRLIAPTRVITGTITDITKRKLADLSIRSSEEKLRSLFEQSPLGISLCRMDGTFLQVNQAFADIIGYQVEACLALTYWTITPADYRDHEEAQLKMLIDTGRYGPFQKEYIRKDGRRVAVLLNGVLIRDLNGSQLIWSFIEDITPRKAAEDALLQSRDAAESASRAKSEFLATMSHEIRTPMNGIIGMSRLLLGTTLSAEQREFAEIVRTSADNLLNLLNDILDLSKIEAGRLELEAIPFDVRATVDEVVALMASRIVERQLECVIDCDPELSSHVIGDPVRLRQVLLNLVSNAVKFTHVGEVVVLVRADQSGRLRFDIRDTGIGIDADVRRGLFTAFSQADSSTTRKYGGTGLGLAICKRLIDLMGGEVAVDSMPGVGSTFTVWIPFRPTLNPPIIHSVTGTLIVQHASVAVRRGLANLAAYQGLTPREVVDLGEVAPLLQSDTTSIAIINGDEPSARAFADSLHVIGIIDRVIICTHSPRVWQQIAGVIIVPKPSRLLNVSDAIRRCLGYAAPTQMPAAILAVTADCRGQSVLVVEDNAINQRIAAALLERLGFTVDTAINGADALEKLEQAQAQQRLYALVLMDCQMPVMDGYTATHTWRQRERSGAVPSHLPIIALTANAFDSDRQRCLAVGMDYFLAKPLQLEELLTALHAVLPGNTLPLADNLGMTNPKTPPSDSVAFDPVPLQRLSSITGNGNLISEVVSLFSQDAANQLSELRRMMEDNDALRLARCAHKLKGACLSVGLNFCATLAEAIDHMASNNNLVAARQALEELEARFSSDLSLLAGAVNQSS